MFHKLFRKRNLMFNIDETENIIEAGIGEIYRGFFRLRTTEQFQREYDTMGTIISMLMKDREHLRKNFDIKE